MKIRNAYEDDDLTERGVYGTGDDPDATIDVPDLGIRYSHGYAQSKSTIGPDESAAITASPGTEND